MEINKDFEFTLNISSEGYEKKTDATCCLSSKGAEAIGRKKMCFFENTVNVDRFLELAKAGHSFCALYRFEANKKYWYTNSKGQKFLGYPHYTRNSKTSTLGGLKIDFKRDEYFSGSQVIFIDIDFTKYSDVREYIDSLTFKPTCIYMSYSDGKDKKGIISRRFHLVYIFDKILDADTFKYCSTTLSEALVKDTKEELEDKCGEKMSQYMNGCFGNNEQYTTYSIYSIEDINKYNKELSIDEVRCTTLNLKLQKEEIVVEEPIKDENLFDLRLLNDFDRLDPEKFRKLHSWEDYRRTTKYYYRTEKPEWINGLYQKVDDDYFRLFWKKSNKDGEGRRKSLFQRMCLRKIMNPSITPMELVVNTIIDIMRFYDNSDGVLNSDYIIRNVNNCMDLTIDEIYDKYSGEIEYLLDTTKPKRGIIYKNRESHTKETTFSILDDMYNPDWTVQENLDYINGELEFIISERSLYNYIKDRNLKADSNKLTDAEVIENIDFSLSAIANYNILKDNGIKISKNRLFKIYKNNKDKELDIEDTLSTTLNTKMQKEEMTANNNFSFDFSRISSPFLNWTPKIEDYYPDGLPEAHY